MFEDAALLLTYLIVGVFPVAYNYAIARKLAKKYGGSTIIYSASDEKSTTVAEQQSSREINGLYFRINDIKARDGAICLSLVIDESVLAQLLSKKDSD
ncbi:MAG: hypothetical protein NDF54_03145 [archaeon GB-1867-035]|nr:hypothetical protein [Candidatus Culexmicrobium profundum]